MEGAAAAGLLPLPRSHTQRVGPYAVVASCSSRYLIDRSLSEQPPAHLQAAPKHRPNRLVDRSAGESISEGATLWPVRPGAALWCVPPLDASIPKGLTPSNIESASASPIDRPKPFFSPLVSLPPGDSMGRMSTHARDPKPLCAPQSGFQRAAQSLFTHLRNPQTTPHLIDRLTRLNRAAPFARAHTPNQLTQGGGRRRSDAARAPVGPARRGQHRHHEGVNFRARPSKSTRPTAPTPTPRFQSRPSPPNTHKHSGSASPAGRRPRGWRRSSPASTRARPRASACRTWPPG